MVLFVYSMDTVLWNPSTNETKVVPGSGISYPQGRVLTGKVPLRLQGCHTGVQRGPKRDAVGDAVAHALVPSRVFFIFSFPNLRRFGSIHANSGRIGPCRLAKTDRFRPYRPTQTDTDFESGQFRRPLYSLLSAFRLFSLIVSLPKNLGHNLTVSISTHCLTFNL